MSRIDEELAEAVEQHEAEAAAAEPVTSAPAEGADKPPPRRSLGLLIGLLVMGGAILALILTSGEDAVVYSKGVDELLGDPASAEDRKVRVQGILVKGSLARRDDPCEYRFRMAKNGAELEVRYPQCVVPDTFRDVPNMDVDVTAMGTLSTAGYFEAEQIMAKCPSKYDMKQRARQGEQAPHGEVVPASIPAASEPY